MKQLSRKTWCRGAFLTLCAAPTLLVAIWIVSRAVWGDGLASTEEWERALSSRLGIKITIGDVAYPQSGLAELSQVELRDVETGEPLARAAAIEVTSKTDGYSLEVIALEIDAAQLGRLAQILHERLLCQGIVGPRRCEIFASELTLNDKTASRTLVDLQAAFNSAETGPRLTASFHWPEAVDPEHTVQWSLTRNLDLSPPATRISVNTGQASLPCHLAKVFWPPLERLGPEAEFSGEVSCLLFRHGSAELRGTFSRVDLDALVSEQFPQILSGKATVNIETASLDDGRLHSAAGTVEVTTGGRISRSLLLAAAEHLQLQNVVGNGSSDVVPFRRLAGGFRMDGAELQLRGMAEAGNPGVLITNNTAPLLKVPPNHSTAAANLARVLLPDSRVQVPLASQTSGLVRLLPAPAVIPAAKDSQTTRRSHVPTRLAPAGSSPNVIRER